MREKNIKQHYIPQFYLRNFTDEDGFLNVFNFKRRIQYRVKPSKVNYKKYFHDTNVNILNEILGDKIDDIEHVDHILRIDHEEIVSRRINELILQLDQSEFKSGMSISHEITEEVIKFTILHLIRTPEYRNRIKYMDFPFVFHYGLNLDELGATDQEVLDTIHNLILYGAVKYFVNKEDDLGARYESFFGNVLDELYGYYNQLHAAHRIILVNDSTSPFITSDTPINVNFDPRQYSMTKGLLTPLEGFGKVRDIGYSNTIDRLFLPLSSRYGIYFLSSKNEVYDNYYGFNIGKIDTNNEHLALNLNASTASKSINIVCGNQKKYCWLEEFIDQKKMIKIILEF